jgi:hypothetical protein
MLSDYNYVDVAPRSIVWPFVLTNFLGHEVEGEVGHIWCR